MNLRLKGRVLQVSAGIPGKRLVGVMVLALLLGLIAAAWSQGAYPVDIFQEMHYHQSQKVQEPDRLDAPVDAVPRPLPESRAKWARERATGEQLFNVNCSMCHGLTAGGDGPVGKKFDEYIGINPPPFDSSRIQDLTPGEAFASISNGFGFMPPFQALLSEEDRWALVPLIEATVAERSAALKAINDLPECRRIAQLVELREGRSLGELVDTCGG